MIEHTQTHQNEHDGGFSRESRLWVYGLLIAIATASMIGRIASVKSADGKTPFLSANDRSRWCTIRSLVDYGTYAIDDVIARQGWDSIDKVRHEGRDGALHYYSSKPTLLPTMLAGQYWLIKWLTGASFSSDPFYMGRLMLVLTNVTAMLVYFGMVVVAVERWARTDWGRIFVVAAASFGTFLTTFSITLNNHLIAAVAAMIATYCMLRIWYDGQRSWHYFFMAGLFGGFTAANELPALSLVALIGVLLMIKSPRGALVAFGSGLLIVACGFFGTNFAAHDTWMPAYWQRHVEGGWYDYPGSYWTEMDLQGVDAGEPSRARYAFHTLVGHHGIVSLTPMWLLSAIGAVQMTLRRTNRMALFAVSVGLLTAICLVFYIGLRPEVDRNYGGMTSGPRWMFWFTPLWLLVMIPAADSTSRHKGARLLAILLLGASVFSAIFPGQNPWQHPWIYQYWEALGWI